jgi:hypothetical protein
MKTLLAILFLALATLANADILTNPTSIHFDVTQGASPGAQSFQVTTTTGNHFYLQFPTAWAWGSAYPTAGENGGTVTLSPNTATLSSGTYSYSFNIVSSGSTGISMPVTLTVYDGATPASAPPTPTPAAGPFGPCWMTLFWGQPLSGAGAPTPAGYRLYESTLPTGPFARGVDVGDTLSFGLVQPWLNNLYFSVTAYDSTGAEGPPSNILNASSFTCDTARFTDPVPTPNPTPGPGVKDGQHIQPAPTP